MTAKTWASSRRSASSPERATTSSWPSTSSASEAAKALRSSSSTAALLMRSWGRSRQPLLLWSAVCFSLLAVNKLLVVLDMVIFTGVNLSLARQLTSLSAVGVLIYGFIWEVDR
jgi:hypothetical protein